MRMRQFVLHAALGLLATTLAPVAGTAYAGPVISYNFSYTGTGTDGYGFIATDTGSGSFSFDGTTSPAGLASLLTFSFNFSRTDLGGYTASYTYAKTDVSSFSATFGPGGTLTALTIGTNAVVKNPGSSPSFLNAKFQITSITAGKVVNSANSTITSGGVTLTNTTPPEAAVPEPTTLASALMAVVFGLGYAGRRIRAMV